MSQRPATPAFLFPRAWLALATGIFLGLAVPTLAPGFQSDPSVRPAQASEQATPDDQGTPDSSATDDSDDSAGDSSDDGDDSSDDPPLPYSQDEPIET